MNASFIPSVDLFLDEMKLARSKYEIEKLFVYFSFMNIWESYSRMFLKLCTPKTDQFFMTSNDMNPEGELLIK